MQKSCDTRKSTAPETLTAVIETLIAQADVENISVRDIMASVSRISLTPLLLLPAIALVTPLSGIPLFSTAMGVIIFLVSLQMIIHRDKIWLPEKILNMQVKSTRLRAAFKRIAPFSKWLDRRAHNRLTFLTQQPIVIIPQALCVLSGLVIPFLELIPFSSSLMGLAVSLLAFGMLARDGFILLVACIPYIGIGWLIIQFVT